MALTRSTRRLSFFLILFFHKASFLFIIVVVKTHRQWLKPFSLVSPSITINIVDVSRRMQRRKVGNYFSEY